MTGSSEIEKFSFDSLEAIRRKLLDLTSRNSLLNYRHPKTSLRIIDELPDQVVYELISGKPFQFDPIPEPTLKEMIESGHAEYDEDTGDIVNVKNPSSEQWAKNLSINTSYSLPEETSNLSYDNRHTDLNLQTLLYRKQMDSRLSTIVSKSKTALEESGANILYLTFGFLEWFEHEKSDSKRLAPLFTLPVTIEKRVDNKSGGFVYEISYQEESSSTNITLKEKLQNDFGIILPEIEDEELPESYFQRVTAKVIAREPRWKIKRFATLSLLNFTKQAMYLDLDPSKWPEGSEISEHSIIKQFFSEGKTEHSDNSSYLDEYGIDVLPKVHSNFPLIYDADSSQHSALIDAIEGKNIVIEGPPGTGKSQTITNLIAACISNNKKVLFVAEKMAALNVVKNRLDRADLGNFCLELHSHKTSKQKVFSDLKERFDAQKEFSKPSEISENIQRYELLKDKLNIYVETINTKWGQTGLTIHEIFQKATRYRRKLDLSPSDYRISGINGDTFTKIRQKELIDNAEMMAAIYIQVADRCPGNLLENHYWHGVKNEDLMDFETPKLVEAIIEWNAALKDLEDFWKIHAATLGLNRVTPLPEEIKSVAIALEELPVLEGNERLDQLKEIINSNGEIKDFRINLATLIEQNTMLGKFLKTPEEDDYKLIELSKIVESNRKILGLSPACTITKTKEIREELLNTKNQIIELASNFDRIRTHIPTELAICFQANLKGIGEYQALIRQLLSMPENDTGAASDLFSDNDLGSHLVRLKLWLDIIRPEHVRLKSLFITENLPTTDQLEVLLEELSQSGFSKWFKRSYYQAKNELEYFSNSKKLVLSDPEKNIRELIKHQKMLAEYNRYVNANKLLAPLNRGVDTPIEDYIKQNDWHRSLSEEYGSGFSERGYIKKAIINLPKKIIVDIINENDRSLDQRVIKSLSDFTKVQNTFQSYDAFKDKNVDIADALIDFIKTLTLLIDSSSALLSADFNSLRKCAEVETLLYERVHLRKSVASNTIVDTVYTKKDSVKIQNNQADSSHLTCIDRVLIIGDIGSQNPHIADAINNNPNIKSYDELRNLGGSLLNRVKDSVTASLPFISLTKATIADWCKSCDSLIELQERNQLAANKPEWLGPWLDYIRIRNRLLSNGMEKITIGIENNTISPNQIVDTINLGVYHQLAENIMQASPSLRDFNSMEQMAIREKFRGYDRALLKLQRQEIAYNASRINTITGNGRGKIGTYTEESLIRHYMNQKSPRLSIRKLIKRAPKTLLEVKPCFMMSPISVAQYLEPGKFEFDIVIMDEASQIKPQDAIGAIARGKTLVVVGDPKQLPPTSFFDRLTLEDEDEDEDKAVGLQQTESILDATIPLFRSRRLRWHYRSRHESLIAFSNHNFYDSNLVIFPSPHQDDDQLGIRHHHINKGRFVNGHNIEEAKLIAEAAAEQMIDRPSQSLGIIAMNAKQMAEIERQVDQLIKDKQGFSKAYSLNQASDEPLFIKNLENVQGDERDVIFMSMTYGPAVAGSGAMMQRFGPINSNVGWRRLNVLFTRAKMKMEVFTSMHSSHILTSETSSRGVKALKDFLQYCETGVIEHYTHTGKAPDSDFEISVIEALAEQGYACEPQLGVAGYYLDLAVRDPGQPGRFLMGIECDGATYHSAKSARDRDRLRQEILEELGWEIQRIWSTDWFKNPKGQLAPIFKRLEELKTEPPYELSSDTIGSENQLDERDAITSDDLDGTEIYFDSTAKDIEAILTDYDEKVIREKLPFTPISQRLLRPVMLQSLLEYEPCSIAEFHECIPSYLLEATADSERQYLSRVLELISEFVTDDSTSGY